jgi:hypothetical protein
MVAFFLSECSRGVIWIHYYNKQGTRMNNLREGLDTGDGTSEDHTVNVLSSLVGGDGVEVGDDTSDVVPSTYYQ